MSLNGITIHALVNELKKNISNVYVEKIYQENKDIIFKLRGKNIKTNLIFSFSSDQPSIFLSDTNKDNPQNPPMFCMLLRKYLEGSIINNIEQIGLDRVIKITFIKTDIVLGKKEYCINLEIMGKYSNFIFYDPVDNLIIDSLVRVYPDMSSVRLILPKENYQIIHDDKYNLLDLDYDDIFNIFTKSEYSVSKTLLFYFQGFSTEIGKELSYLISDNDDGYFHQLSDNKKEVLILKLLEIKNIISSESPKCFVYFKNNIPYKLSIIPLTYMDLDFKEFNNIIEAVRFFYEKKYLEKVVNSRNHALIKQLENKIKSLEKTLSIQYDDLEKSKKRDEIKIQADLLASNIYNIKPGMDSITVYDYFRDTDLKIPLDKKISPQKNVEKLYNKYNKYKNSENILSELIPANKNIIKYLKNTIVLINSCETIEDLDIIKYELSENKILPQSSKKNNIKIKDNFKTFTSPSGYNIITGKNNVQNDKITFKISHKSDTWFHVKDYPGTHLVIQNKGEKLTDEDIRYAAMLTAKLSGINAKCSVDYTEIKNVKKIKGPNPGLVTYTNQKTITV